MKNFMRFLAAALLLTGVTGCEYDDDELWDKVNELEEQVSENSETIATLQALINALNQGKVITEVKQTTEGYTLVFSDGSEVSVKNGKDGQNGADGKDGQDGKEGQDGKDGQNGDSYFKSVEVTETSVIITLSDGTVIELPRVVAEENNLRILSFEDADAKFSPYTIRGYDSASDSYYDHTVSTWSDLIDQPEYGGPLCYGDMGYMGQMLGCDYHWYDEGNTFLATELPVNYYSQVYWGGGHVVSNYASTDYTTNGTFQNQQTVYGTTGQGGRNGSPNFGMHYGYKDGSSYNMTENLPYLYFGDGVARVIDHMYVMNSCYAIACYMDGNGLTAKIGEEDWVKAVATGYAEDGSTTTAEIYLCNGPDGIVLEWTKWDLSVLGKVLRVEFNITGSSDNGYGFSQPAYFAYDDVAVVVE